MKAHRRTLLWPPPARGPAWIAAAFSRAGCFVALLLLPFVLRSPVQAHDSPEHVIEGLTARIHAEPGRPELFWRRAVEHRVLGDLSAAARDLQQALKLQRNFLPALAELSRVHLAQRNPKQALAVINRALD